MAVHYLSLVCCLVGELNCSLAITITASSIILITALISAWLVFGELYYAEHLAAKQTQSSKAFNKSQL